MDGWMDGWMERKGEEESMGVRGGWMKGKGAGERVVSASVNITEKRQQKEAKPQRMIWRDQ